MNIYSINAPFSNINTSFMGKRTTSTPLKDICGLVGNKIDIFVETFVLKGNS